MIVATTSEETEILLKLKDTATKNGGIRIYKWSRCN
jgi:hypothetical protein